MRWLVCPNCRSELSEDGPRVACQHGHSFPVTSGVPRLIDDPRGGVIGRSFSEEWQALDYERDRSWGREVEKRAEFFLRHVGMEPDGLRGKVVLDVGCGHGTLSNELTKFGCQVVAADISTSVIAARQKFPDNDALHLVQADLLRSPFRSGAFDVVYAGGVLHHTPSTRGALAATVGALAPGGVIFLWLYWRLPGMLYTIKSVLRHLLTPFPLAVKRGVAHVFAGQSFLRHRGRDRTWSETVLSQVDYFTPRWRWEHTPQEVESWLLDLGLSDIETVVRGRDGFGVRARARHS